MAICFECQQPGATVRAMDGEVYHRGCTPTAVRRGEYP